MNKLGKCKQPSKSLKDMKVNCLKLTLETWRTHHIYFATIDCKRILWAKHFSIIYSKPEKLSKEIPFGFYGSHHVDDIPFNYFFVSAEVVQLKSEIHTIMRFLVS